MGEEIQHMGLTSEEARKRKEAGLDNKPVKAATRTVRQIITDNTFTYFNLIFLIIAILLILARSFRNLTFLPVIIANTMIGIVQEIRSKETLEKLQVMNEPKIKVVRDGELQELSSADAVKGDIALLEAGNQICADMEVVSGEVAVNESLLTGESDEIRKGPGLELMSGSFVVSGSCYARLEKVGEESYISKLTLQATKMEVGEQSEMIRSLDKIVKLVGIIILPLGIVMFGQQYLFNFVDFSKSITSMVAAVIGMIPEGLYLLASVALAVSSMRLAAKKVLLHEMKSIETLARVDVLCVDKTGTITGNDMAVERVILAGNGEFQNPDTELEEKEALSRRIGSFVGALNADNITMKAMKNYFRDPMDYVTVESVSDFSSVYKYSGVNFTDGSFVLGAPEFVLREDYAAVKNTVERFAQEGYRCLVFGKTPEVLAGQQLTEAVEVLGFVCLSNPIRPDAKETFHYFNEQNVEIKVISGDNPVTVSRVAAEAGIKGAEHFVDASTLKTDEQIAEAIRSYTVFGRVTPEQKRKFVRALKADGRTVAMTGDGVNDILALKDADCSIAMASGSDAAAQAAQLVLLDSNFSCMPDVVAEGRRVVNNIERSGTLFLVKNIFSMVLAILSICFGVTYPLEPSQISLISTYTIGVPAFFLAMLPNNRRIEGRFLSNILKRALPAGLTDVIVVEAMVWMGNLFELDRNGIATASTFLLALVGFYILYRISRPMNLIKYLIFVGSILGLLFCTIYLKWMFAISFMNIKIVTLLILTALATVPLLNSLKAIVEAIFRECIRIIHIFSKKEE